MANERLLVLYHANCSDGFCAAWIAQKAHPNAECIAVNYGEAPPDVTDRDVIILDFSYPRNVLLEMQSKSSILNVLDHHKTAEKELEGLRFCIFSSHMSGAAMAWKWFFPYTPLPLLVEYVQDRDLWKFELPHSKAINAAIRSYPLDFQIWENLFLREFQGSLGEFQDSFVTLLANEGEAILRMEQQIIELQAKKAVKISLADKREIFSCNATAHISELGSLLAKDRPFSAIYYIDENGKYKYSLRSSDAGEDVSIIAKHFGGGGHRNAAGFTSNSRVF